MDNEKERLETIIVRLLVELPEGIGLSPFVFHRWLPRENECLTHTSNHYQFRIWFDLDCVNSLYDINEDDIPKMVNVLVGKMHVELSIPNISPELSKYIFMCGMNLLQKEKMDLSEFVDLETSYNDLAKQVYIETLDTINTVISIVRNERGQYWNLPIPNEEGNEMSFFVSSKAKVKSSNFPFVPWHPPLGYTIICNMESSERFIHEEDWAMIQEKLSKNQSNTLIKEIIVYAEQLLAEGHIQSALILSVVSLELSLSSFLKNPHLELKVESVKDIRGDLEIQNLKKLHEKLGLRGSIAVLLPLILAEDQFPPDLIRICREAVEVRGNIVHHGQRKLDSAKIREYIGGIRSAIEILSF